MSHSANLKLRQAKCVSEEMNSRHGLPLLQSAIGNAIKKSPKATSLAIRELECLSLMLHLLDIRRSLSVPFEKSRTDKVVTSSLEDLKKVLASLATFVERPDVEQTGDEKLKLLKRPPKKHKSEIHRLENLKSKRRGKQQARRVVERSKFFNCGSEDFIDPEKWFEQGLVVLDVVTQSLSELEEHGFLNDWKGLVSSSHQNLRFSTVLSGLYLPNAFSMIYSGVDPTRKKRGPRGDQQHEDPIFTFIHSCMMQLGCDPITFDTIDYNMRRFEN